MNFLITGAWAEAQKHIQTIESDGHTVRFMQNEKDELPCSYEWVEGLICNGLFLSHPINKFTNLKYIQLTSAGLDRVPLDYIKEHDIVIKNARGVYSIPMAEYAICGVLDIYKKMGSFRKNQEQHSWLKIRSLSELQRKKVCIVGCGSVGTECARLFKAFGCDVVGVATYRRKQAFFDEIMAIDELKNILSVSDIIIITVPLTKATEYLFNKEMLLEIKNGAVIVNISRGKVMDYHALEQIAENKLGGAVLDVFEEEPLSKDSQLWDMENVIITPHNSYVGEYNSERLNNVILNNVFNLHIN